MANDTFQPKIKIEYCADKDLETIELRQIDTVTGRIQLDTLRLRDAATRAALIDLGWTPPKKD